MANVKISELPVAASVDGASSFPVVEGGVKKQVTFTGMLASPSLFASGMATFFATPSSANLRAALTDETGTGAAVFADSPTLVGPTVGSGNVTFSGTAQRITGDFSNATIASRVMFQTSTTNGATSVSVLPNGSSTEANVAVFANSSPTNSAVAVLAMTSTDARVLSAITGSGTYVPLTLHTGGAERVRVDTSGNVGIGTNAPNVALDVQDSGGVEIRAKETAAGVDVRLNALGGAGNVGIVGTYSNHPVVVFVNSAERARFDASGNVLVGAATANARLTVSGSVLWTTGASFAGATNNSAWVTGFASQAINASIQASDSIAGANIYAISDVRLKSNIRPIPSGLAFVNEVDAVQFTRRESGIEDTGFIAQNLLKKGFGHLVSAVPDAAMQEMAHGDGNVSPAGSRFVVKYDSVVPILCKAIQEQQTIINDLRARVSALEA
jgi:hypothetical protein